MKNVARDKDKKQDPTAYRQDVARAGMRTMPPSSASMTVELIPGAFRYYRKRLPCDDVVTKCVSDGWGFDGDDGYNEPFDGMFANMNIHCFWC